MAKRIYMSENDIAKIIQQFRTKLESMKCNGTVSINHTIDSDDRKAVLYFTPVAYLKMTSLVARFTTEVEWHGLVQRISEHEYEVYDIIVPPHEVGSATVTSDYAEYTKWLNDLDDDTFNHLNFHGHSHVDMSVSPSAVDCKYRKDIITQLPAPSTDSDVFYLFLIINKRHEWSAEIYDLTNNALYETKDIEIVVYIDNNCETVESFITEAKKVAVAAAPTNIYSAPYYGGRSYNGYYSQQPAVTNKPVATTPKQPVKKEKTVEEIRKEIAAEWGYDSWEEYLEGLRNRGLIDDDDDPSDPFYYGKGV